MNALKEVCDAAIAWVKARDDLREWRASPHQWPSEGEIWRDLLTKSEDELEEATKRLRDAR